MASRADQERRERRYSDAKVWAEKQDDGSGGDFVRFFKLPDGVGQFKPKEKGDYKLHIIPYEVQQDHNPLADVGMVHPERTFYVHGGMGSSGKDTYVCLESYNKARCPICEWIGSFGGQMPSDRYKDVRQKTRQLWNVIDVTNRESEAKGIQVWETNYTKGFGEQLRKKILLVEAYRKFYRPKGGNEILISIEPQTISAGRKPFMAVTAVEIVPREKEYPESIIDKAYDLDSMLIFHTYAELKQLVEEGRIGDGKEASKAKVESNGDARTKDREPPASRERRREPEPEPEPEDRGGDVRDDWKKGDEVTFEYRGKTHEGKVTAVKKADKLVKVESKEGRTHTVDFADLRAKEEPEPDAGGDSDWDDDAPAAPAKKGGKAPVKSDDDWD